MRSVGEMANTQFTSVFRTEAAGHKPSLGELGEQFAADFLMRAGYRIVIANFKVPVGRNSRGIAVTGEIDIVALDRETLCFVEVKTRRSDDFAAPEANVDARKQRQIIRTAKVYRRLFNVWDMPHRYDIVTVLLPKHASRPEIELKKAFWTEAKFRKKMWHTGGWGEYS
jgi:putative endonuclease